MFAQSDNASFIDHEAKSAGAVTAEPEKLGIRRTPFQCVEISRMEKLKLPAACWIKAMLNHESAPTEDAIKVVAREAVTEITEAKEKASSVRHSTLS